MTNRHMSKPTRFACVLLVMLGCTLMGACAKTNGGGPDTSTETGNPPVIDALRISLVVDSDGARLVGEPGAVTPGGATVEVEVLDTGETLSVTAEADGSFEIALPAGGEGVYLVQGRAGGQTGAQVFVYQGGAQVAQTQASGLSCEARDDVFQTVLGAVLASADQSCQVDSDCDGSFQTECFYEDWLCGSYETYSTRGAAGIRRALNALGAVCDGYEAAGCWSGKPIADCGPLARPVCRAGQCAGCEGLECLQDSDATSCEARQQTIEGTFEEVLSVADRSCSVDSDCAVISSGGQRAETETSCPHPDWFCGMSQGISQLGAMQIRETADQLADGACDQTYLDDCYSPPPADCELQEAFCRAGQCEVCWGQGCSADPPPIASSCAPQDFEYPGPPCDVSSGTWHWLGDVCQAFTLCECLGVDCQNGYATEQACLDAHADCSPTICGGIAGLQCAAGEYCAYVASQRCGAADQTGTCQPIPDACDGNYDPVCGCDGTTYSNLCVAATAGVAIDSHGECP